VTTSQQAARQPAPGNHALPPDTSELEVSLAAVELAIATLGQTLTRQDIAAVEAVAQVARRGTMPAALRTRFAMANGQITAQREALFRASSIVEQGLEILIPRPMAETSVYSATGSNQRGPGRMIAAS
jgi:hypothetical protein